MSGADYCEMCDLPLSTCVHGMPKPPPEPPKSAPVRTRTTSAAKASPVARRRTPERAAAPARPRLRTHQSDFRPWLVGVLQDAGGTEESEVAILEVERRMAAVLLPGDRELGPQGEPRWRTALRWARKELADEGLLHAPQPGVWALTDLGRALPTEIVARPEITADPADPADD